MAQQVVVLVVDDEPDIRELAGSALSSSGYHVLTAPNAQAALFIMRAVSVDVLFTDVVMPGDQDGFELARIASSLNPALRVIFASGYNSAQKGASTPPGIMLAKPYVAHQLVQKVQHTLMVQNAAT